MKQYIVSWTVTLNADDADQAEQQARDILAAGDATFDIEQVAEGDEVAL